jgi:predicted Zn-dependent protease with MMP-like domain
MRDFCGVVRAVLDDLPEPFHQWLENVTVDVEVEPAPEVLDSLGIGPDEDPPLGLFDGIEITETEYGQRPFNRIIIYKGPIERTSRSREEIAYEIRRTVIHELAHHFGYSEEDLDEFESTPSPFDE